MKQQDKIMKAVLNTVDAIKDTVERNVFAAVQAGNIKIDKEALPMLMQFIRQSVDEGYQLSYKSVSKSVGLIFDEDVKDKATKKT